MFPAQSGHDNLESSWDQSSRNFEKNKLARLFEEDTLCSKIVGRDQGERREHGERYAAR
jgi:hypothetical protein